ncbi:MAG: DUF3883 domain-containing protein, partial [Flavobacterium sp.]
QDRIQKTEPQVPAGANTPAGFAPSKAFILPAAVVASEKLKYRQAPASLGTKKKPYFHNGDHNDKLKQLGNSSEDFVMTYLEQHNYSNIYKATEDNEGLHYDIRFTDEKGNIKFIEVKTFNNGTFYLSREEYEFGRANQKDYEIWLVNNGSIIFPIKDFFTNAKYLPVPNQFIVYLDIEN